MKKNALRIFAAILLALSLALAMASCDMLPAELQDTINGLIGGNKPEACTHENTETAVVNEPTCKVKGKGELVCSDCGEVLETDIVLDKLTTHTPGEWKTVTEPTCNKEGEKVTRCTVCQTKLESAAIPVNSNHDYDYGKCTVCGGDQPETMSLVFKSLGNGTASVTGLGSYSGSSVIVPATSPTGEKVVSIAANAFRNKSNITSVIIPDTVTSIGDGAFEGCRIVRATVPAPVASAIKNTQFLWSVVITGKGEIPANALSGCASLTSVEISTGVSAIGNAAFSGCDSLNTVKMANSVTKIGQSAFNGCIALSGLVLSTSLKEIGSNAFQRCHSITGIVIPASVTSIGYRAFNGCIYLSEAHFEVSSGWNISGMTVTPQDIADPSTAASLLKSSDVTWTR